jgi:colanic acid/amylovoran biosynthesis glycosyltransferase
VPLDDFKTDDRTKVLTVAKFHDYKGYDTLVDAVRMMKGKRVVFWIVGEGPIDVRGMASDLISAGTVKVFGAVDEELLKILYQACDIFCLPSKTSPSGQKEGLPVSIMEAMAFSKPVVSTAHAGIPELVDTILVPENDPKALADAIEAYMRDPELRNRDGKRNRQAVERLNGPENLDRLVALFESIK